MITTREYLSSTTCYWMNLDVSEERRDQFLQRTAPLFKKAIRISAVDGNLNANDRAHEWFHLCKETFKKEQFLFDNEPQPTEWSRIATRPDRMLKYSRTYALYQTVIKAIRRAMVDQSEPFMIMEDDAVPRLGELDTCPLPSQESPFRIWGGYYPMAYHTGDNLKYAGGAQLQWREVLNPKSMSYVATAYEITDSITAQTVLNNFIANPLPVDISWRKSFTELRASRLTPSLFVQQGMGDRIGKMREGVVER